MSYANFIREHWESLAKSIQLGLVCKIKKYDKQKMRANVEPVIQRKNELDETVDYPILVDVPVAFLYSGGYYIRPDYQTDDLVWVTFSTFDTEYALKEEKRPESETIFNMENACVQNGITKKDFSDVSDFSNSGLLIGHKDGLMIQVDTDKLYIKNASKIEMLGATESFVKGDTLQTELNKDKTLMGDLVTAFTNWTPVAQDGGAALKAQLVQFLIDGANQADYSQIKSTKIKGE